MKLNELREGYAVMVEPCYGMSNKGHTIVGLMIVNVLGISDGLVKIEDRTLPDIIAFVDPKNLSGIRLNDCVMKIIGFSPIGTQCPIYNGNFAEVYEINIGGKMHYVIYDGDRYKYVRGKSSTPDDVLFVHDLQGLIKGFEVPKNNFANALS